MNIPTVLGVVAVLAAYHYRRGIWEWIQAAPILIAGFVFLIFVIGAWTMMLEFMWESLKFAAAHWKHVIACGVVFVTMKWMKRQDEKKEQTR